MVRNSSCGVIAVVAVLISIAAHAPAQRFDPPRNYFDSALVEQVASAGINYAKAFALASRRSDNGLSTLFQATLHTDGVGADQHSEILLDQLQQWGDTGFARVLSTETETVRTRVRCALDYAACSDWAKRYPRTAALSRRDPNCVCT